MNILNSTILILALFMLGSCQAKKDSVTSRKIIASTKAPEAVGPYSQAIQVDNTLYLAGQVGLNPETGKLSGESIESQTRQALQNIKFVLDKAGFSITDIVDVQVFLTDVSKYSSFNKLYAEWVGAHPPARTLVEVSELPIGAKVEIKVTAINSN